MCGYGMRSSWNHLSGALGTFREIVALCGSIQIPTSGLRPLITHCQDYFLLMAYRWIPAGVVPLCHCYTCGQPPSYGQQVWTHRAWTAWGPRGSGASCRVSGSLCWTYTMVKILPPPNPLFLTPHRCESLGCSLQTFSLQISIWQSTHLTHVGTNLLVFTSMMWPMLLCRWIIVTNQPLLPVSFSFLFLLLCPWYLRAPYRGSLVSSVTDLSRIYLLYDLLSLCAWLQTHTNIYKALRSLWSKAFDKFWVKWIWVATGVQSLSNAHVTYNYDFKAHNSVAFSTLTVLCKHHPCRVPQHFYHTRKKSCTHEVVTFHCPSSSSLATTNLPSISGFTILGIS